MDYISEWFKHNFGLAVETQEKILSSLIAVLLLMVIRKIILNLVFKRIEDVKVRYKWRKTSTYLLSFLGFLVLVKIWFQGFGSLATFLGLLSAGIAIALKDPIVNLVAWAFIMIRKPFDVGDRIQIGSVSGDVIDLRIFQFTIMEIGNWVDADQSTGRIIHVPNGKVFTDFQANYSTGFNYIWNELGVLVTFESDWEKAKKILTDILNKHAENLTEDVQKKIKETSRRFMIFYSVLTPIVYTSVKDSGVMLTMRYLCDVRKRRISAATIWEEVLIEFAKHDNIDFAYPTTRFYDNLSEGKPGTKPKNHN
jgi:small-conductance mechanosensitive channel